MRTSHELAAGQPGGLPGSTMRSRSRGDIRPPDRTSLDRTRRRMPIERPVHRFAVKPRWPSPGRRARRDRCSLPGLASIDGRRTRTRSDRTPASARIFGAVGGREVLWNGRDASGQDVITRDELEAYHSSNQRPKELEDPAAQRRHPGVAQEWCDRRARSIDGLPSRVLTMLADSRRLSRNRRGSTVRNSSAN